MKTSTMMTVAYRMAERTSIVACATTSIGCSRLCGWLARSAFSRRSTFSTPTTASSTRPPMAIARPPSVIVLIDRPKYLKTSAVMKIDTGMAVSAMMVGRRVPRKKNRITATKTEAPISLPCSVVIEASMKLAWRKVTRGASMPAGSDAFNPTSASSMDLVSAMVSAVGCFWMPRMTAGLPSKPASPRLSAAAKVTSAIWRIRMGWPSLEVSARFFRSSSREVRPRLRIRYSRPLSSRNPPEVLAE
jgi:hypothetical protein